MPGTSPVTGSNFFQFHVVITARKRSLGQGNVFRGVCLSMGVGGVWLPSMHHRLHDQQFLPPGGSASRGGLHPGRGLLPGGVCIQRGVCVGRGQSASRRVSIWGGGRGWADPLKYMDTMGYGQQGGGTHLTGMHSCQQKFCQTRKHSSRMRTGHAVTRTSSDRVAMRPIVNRMTDTHL